MVLHSMLQALNHRGNVSSALPLYRWSTKAQGGGLIYPKLRAQLVSGRTKMRAQKSLTPV